MRNRTILSLVITLSICFSASAQNNISELRQLLDSTRRERNDSTRIALNSQFKKLLLDYIQKRDFIPDSLNSLTIGRTTSPDNFYIFYNWNIQQNKGNNIYSAIIYLPSSGKTIVLPDKGSELKLSQDSVYSSNDWPAALYYKIIPPRDKKSKYYLMLGWDRFEPQTSRKVIEAVTFTGDSVVIFGKEVFKTKEGRANRVVVEYASSASLTLQYSKQKLTLSGVRKSQSKINDSIIVVDRLIPLNPELEGQYWAYVPAGNTYDGYIYFKDFWTFVEGINARNPALKNDERKRNKKPELDLFPENR